MIEAIDHVVLYSGDSERTIAFYQDVLGCVVEGVDEWREGQRRQAGPLASIWEVWRREATTAPVTATRAGNSPRGAVQYQ